MPAAADIVDEDFGVWQSGLKRRQCGIEVNSLAEAKVSGSQKRLGSGQFYIDNNLNKTTSSPYWLFQKGLYGSISNSHTITAKIINGGQTVTGSIKLITNSINQTTSNDTGATNTTNLLRNSGFTIDLQSWGYHSGGYTSWVLPGKEDAGAIHFTPNLLGVTEAYQGRWRVHPGDKVIIKGWARSGPLTNPKWNNGTGIGWDLRIPGDNTIIYAMNGPATVNNNWVNLYAEHIVPCIGRDDTYVESWQTTDGKSGTQLGAKAGLTNSDYVVNNFLGKRMPADLDLSVWVQIWHQNTVDWGELDNIRLEIIPGALSC